MLQKLGYDIFNIIAIFIFNYNDLLSLKSVNRFTYYHIFNNKDIELTKHSKVNLRFLKKISILNLIIYNIPKVNICKLLNCTFAESLLLDTLTALHIQDCYTFCTPIVFNRYYSLVALYLYNFIIDPDDLHLPNLEYLCIYESDCDDSYIYMFDVERFPKLKYLDLSKIYIDDDNANVPLLEYYNGCIRNYIMPCLKYIEISSDLVDEQLYLNSFPSLQVIITDSIPNKPFEKISIIKPECSKIAQSYYNTYFLIKKID